MQAQKQDQPQQREQRGLSVEQAEQRRPEGKPEQVAAIPGPAVEDPQQVDRNSQTREHEHGPQQPCNPRVDEPQRKHKWKSPGQIPHEADFIRERKPRGALDPRHSFLIIGIVVVRELLSGCPEDDEIACAGSEWRQKQGAVAPGYEPCRQSADGYEWQGCDGAKYLPPYAAGLAGARIFAVWVYCWSMCVTNHARHGRYSTSFAGPDSCAGSSS